MDHRYISNRDLYHNPLFISDEMPDMEDDFHQNM